MKTQPTRYPYGERTVRVYTGELGAGEMGTLIELMMVYGVAMITIGTIIAGATFLVRRQEQVPTPSRSARVGAPKPIRSDA